LPPGELGRGHSSVAESQRGDSTPDQTS
jgi:hypothetical protein